MLLESNEERGQLDDMMKPKLSPVEREWLAVVACVLGIHSGFALASARYEFNRAIPPRSQKPDRGVLVQVPTSARHKFHRREPRAYCGCRCERAGVKARGYGRCC